MKAATISALSVLGLTLVANAAVAAPKTYLLESTYMDKGYAALGARAMKINGENETLVGVEWSWAAAPKFNLGLNIYGVATDGKATNPDDAEDSKDMGVTQVGIRGEYLAYDYKLVTLAADMQVGAGLVGYRGSFSDPESTKYKNDNFRFIDLGGTAYVHITPELDLGIGGGYQTASGASLAGVTSKDLGGMYGTVRVRRWF